MQAIHMAATDTGGWIQRDDPEGSGYLKLEFIRVNH
jgi:hypothetical protein